MTKGGVDEAEKMLLLFQQSPKVADGSILPHSGLERHECLYILYNMHQPKSTDRGDFLKSLARSLGLPRLQRRVV